MNPEMQNPASTDSPSSSPRRTLLNVLAVALGLALAAGALLWPKGSPSQPSVPTYAAGGTPPPSGCTRSLAQPAKATQPSSGCGNCAKAAAGDQAPAEACDMHTATPAHDKAKTPGASHDE